MQNDTSVRKTDVIHLILCMASVWLVVVFLRAMLSVLKCCTGHFVKIIKKCIVLSLGVQLLGIGTKQSQKHTIFARRHAVLRIALYENASLIAGLRCSLLIRQR